MYIYIRFLEAFANFYLLFIIICLDTNTMHVLLRPKDGHATLYFCAVKVSETWNSRNVLWVFVVLVI